MLTVDQKELIRREYFLKRKSIREIAREMNRSRKTIRKAIADSGIPTYTRQAEPPKPVIGAHIETMRTWLEEDKARPPKQRHSARRIFERLRDEKGYQGTARTVRREVRRLRGVVPESFVPQTYEPGEGATFDFGEARVFIGGVETHVHLACLRLDYSSKFFVCALPSERQEALFEAHLQGLSYLEGVPARIRYDNMKTAVRKVLAGRNRSEQEQWTAFRSHFLFEAHYCTPGRGQEKGGVENLVGYARRNFLVPLPHFDDFKALNAYLVECCERDARTRLRHGRSVEALYAEERGRLRPLPEHLPQPSVARSAKVDRRQLIRIDGNRYSTPACLVGKTVTVHVFVFKVVIAHGEKTIATHPREYRRDQEILDPHHYLPVLLEKPGAFERATPIVGWKLPAVFERFHDHLKERFGTNEGINQYIRTLMLLSDHPLDRVAGTLEQAIACRVCGLDAVVNLLQQSAESVQRVDSLDVCSPEVWPNGVAHFDRLLAAQEATL